MSTCCSQKSEFAVTIALERAKQRVTFKIPGKVIYVSELGIIGVLLLMNVKKHW